MHHWPGDPEDPTSARLCLLAKDGVRTQLQLASNNGVTFPNTTHPQCQHSPVTMGGVWVTTVGLVAYHTGVMHLNRPMATYQELSGGVQ